MEYSKLVNKPAKEHHILTSTSDKQYEETNGAIFNRMKFYPFVSKWIEDSDPSREEQKTILK